MNSPRTLPRRTYLLSCMRVSLLKRWYWLALSALTAVIVGFAVNLNGVLMIALALVAPVLVGLAIAADSYRRHLHD